MKDSQDLNLAGQLTAEGMGGVHLIQISGPRVRGFLAEYFEARGNARKSPVFGLLKDGDDLIDEILLQTFDAGEELVVDLGLHGSEAVRQRVKSLLEREGFRWETCAVDRAFAEHSLPLGIEEEAKQSLRESWALQSTLFFASVLEGGLRREIEGLLLDVAAPSPNSMVTTAVEARLQSLLDRAPFGVAMADPPVIAVLGAVNAGKSTLVNQLCGLERVIAGDEPGMTRDLVEAPIEIFDYPFRLVDTAGFRDTDHVVERLGISRAREIAATAHIQLVIADATRWDDSGVELGEDDGHGFDVTALAAAGRRLRVFNKVDLLSLEVRQRLEGRFQNAILISARTGEGMDALRRALVFASPFRGPAGREFAMPFTGRQIDRLQEALSHWPQDNQAVYDSLDSLIRAESWC